MKKESSKKLYFPASTSLSMLFTNDIKNRKRKSRVEFRIPDFQRQYSWKNNNLQELWKDLNEAFRNKEEIYFLGSVVLVQEGANKFSIIDGQQRLTTLVIMMDVLLRDFKDRLDRKTENSISKYHDNIFKLQSNPNYDMEFKEEIKNKESFAHEPDKTVSEKELASSDPRFRYRNTAYFFFDKFQSFDGDINTFIDYIFNNVFVIRTICYDENFAIKMFISLNDRGLPLSNADIFKSWLYSRCKKDWRGTFNQEWKGLVKAVNEVKITMDDFVVWYEYYRLRKNPKMSVTDALKIELEKEDCESIMSDLSKYMECVKRIYYPTENTNLIYSLRYIKWKAYVMSILASAYRKEYYDMVGLLKLLRKFYYIAWGSGGNVNSVKQTSFNILECVVNNSPLEEVEQLINSFIYKKNRITNFYEAIGGDVYDTDYFKPLLMSVEYNEWPGLSLQFQPIDYRLHLDHILPKKFAKDKDWDYIKNTDKAAKKMNTMGNMALLEWYKNEIALNKGFKKKLYFYNGLEEDGITEIKDENGKNVTKFRTTQAIIEEFRDKPKRWTLKSIDDRSKYLKEKIEKLLDVKEEDKYIVLDNKSEGIKRGKWKYKNQVLSNFSFIKQLLSDYIIDKGIKKFEDIPGELVRFQIYSQDFIKKETVKNKDMRDRYLLEINRMKLYVNSIYRSPGTIELVEKFKQYYDFDCERVDR